MSDRIEQIRRAHASATPDPIANPAWFHAENEIGLLLARIDELSPPEKLPVDVKVGATLFCAGTQTRLVFDAIRRMQR